MSVRTALETWRLRAGRARDACILATRVHTVAQRPLPEFVILGAQKAGTSSLYARLAAHPRVVPALRKEVHYFDTHSEADPDRYRAFFPTEQQLTHAAQRAGARAITGEATPYYLFHPAAPARARRVIPDARLIAVVRDPVARAVSGYHHAVRFGHERRPIEVALDPRHEERLANVADEEWYDGRSSPARLRGYLARGRYAEQLERWIAHYPGDQVLVVESAALRARDALARVFEFLGLDLDQTDVTPDRNVGSYPAPPARVVESLSEYFARYNEDLFALLGERFDWSR